MKSIGISIGINDMLMYTVYIAIRRVYMHVCVYISIRMYGDIYMDALQKNYD